VVRVAERITIEHVGKVYPGGNRALDDVALEVNPGTFLVLLGPSGSGKTTLLRSLAGIERVTSGRITIGGLVVADDRVHVPPERRDLSMVFQDYALWPHMAALDNVAFALKRRGIGRPEARQLALAMLERVGLGSLSNRYPTELSGGEQQRVALARALIGDTGLILCDEPLSNLDADLRERMRIEISSLVRAAGATTIYITHDQSEAFALADRVGVLERGRLVQLGTPEEIYARPATPFVARFTGLAGELPVQVHTAPDGEACVEVEPSGLQGARRVRVRTSGLHREETAALLMMRPAAVRLCPTDTGEHHLLGHVADVAFRGRGYEHAVELSDGTQINSIFSEVRFERAERVGLRLETAGCLVFPPDRTQDATPGDSENRPPTGPSEALAISAAALRR
jgi:ABC-type Fe3+/spermidine/putrescine transport system ATPase subunit